MTKDVTWWGNLPGTTPVFGALIVLTLAAISVTRHPSAIQGTGNRIFWLDLVLLLIYGAAGIWGRYQSSATLNGAIRLGTMTGFLFGAVLVANHVAELFVPTRTEFVQVEKSPTRNQ